MNATDALYEQLFATQFASMVRLAHLLGADDPQDVAQEAFVRSMRPCPGCGTVTPFSPTCGGRWSTCRVRDTVTCGWSSDVSGSSYPMTWSPLRRL